MILTKEKFRQHELATVCESLQTGIFQFDKQNGINVDDFIVLAGSSGSGKSTIALYIACSVAKSGKKVFYCNTENDEKVMVGKIKALGFDFYNDFGINDTPENFILINVKSVTFDNLKAAVSMHKPVLLVVDLFSSLLDGARNYDIPERTREYATNFSFFPEKYKCAVLVTEQLVKDNQRIRRPGENDIAGGKSIVTKATKVIIIYRYVKENIDKMLTSNTNFGIANYVSELIIKKDRHGRLPLHIFLTKFIGGVGFKELLTGEYKEYQQILKGKNHD